MRLFYSHGEKVGVIRDLSAKGADLLYLRGHAMRITDVSWHSSGKFVATSSVDGTVKIWNALSKRGFSVGARCISWHPSGKQYVSSLGRSVLIC